MKYCSECGHQNADHVKFCESCGHAFTEQAAPAQPIGQQAASEVSAAVKKTSDVIASAPRPPVKLIAIGAVALVVLVVLWAVFLKPLSPSAYERKAEDYLVDISDGMLLINEGVSGLYSYGYEEKMTAEEYADYEEDIDEGTRMASRAAKGLRSLRAPSEFKAADRRIKSFASYIIDDAVPAAEKLIDDVSPGMTGERLDTRISRYWEQNSSGAQRAYENLGRASEDLYIPGGLWGEGGGY